MLSIFCSRPEHFQSKAQRFAWKCTDEPSISARSHCDYSSIVDSNKNLSRVKTTAANQIGVKMPCEVLVIKHNVLHETAVNKTKLSCLLHPRLTEIHNTTSYGAHGHTDTLLKRHK